MPHFTQAQDATTKKGKTFHHYKLTLANADCDSPSWPAVVQLKKNKDNLFTASLYFDFFFFFTTLRKLI